MSWSTYLACTAPRAAPSPRSTRPHTRHGRGRRRGPPGKTEGGLQRSAASATPDTALRWRTDTWETSSTVIHTSYRPKPRHEHQQKCCTQICMCILFQLVLLPDDLTVLAGDMELEHVTTLHSLYELQRNLVRE